MEKAYLVYVRGELSPWELRNKYGSLIRRRKREWALLQWALVNGYDVERNNDPPYES